MSEIHAAIGLSQFNRLVEFVADRRRVARIYDEEFETIEGLTSLKIPSEAKSNYYKYVAFLKHGIDRVSLKKGLREKYSVSLSGEVYELPCHLQPIFKKLYNFNVGEFPVAEDLCRRQICLPVFAGMTEQQAEVRYIFPEGGVKVNIGVIGGSGFIGSHVVDKLLEHGHEATVFDIMKPHRSGVRHIYIDIIDLSKTCIALTGAYDAVYMLAAMADVNDVYKNPVEAGEVNIMAVANVLEAARRNAIGTVILASTVWVYEMAESESVNEDVPLILSKAKHVYTASKVAAELYCHAYQKLYGQNFTVLRYGIPYGPRARGGTVIASFVRKALNAEPLTIFGDGSQYRNFIYVEDLAEGNVAALQPLAVNQTYNLEGIRPVTIKEIAETVRKLIGDVGIECKEARPGDYGGAIVSADKAKRELGWEPKVDFEEGLRRYVDWYKENIEKQM